jgi:hypothetical protein
MALPKNYERRLYASAETVLDAVRERACPTCRYEGLASWTFQLSPKNPGRESNEPRAAVIAEISREGEEDGRECSALHVRLLDSALLPSQRVVWLAWWVAIWVLNLAFFGLSWQMLAQQAVLSLGLVLVYAHARTLARRTRDRDLRELIFLLESSVASYAFPDPHEPNYRRALPSRS